MCDSSSSPRPALPSRTYKEPDIDPVHTLPPYADDAAASRTCPTAVDIAARGICLPTYGTIPDEDVDYVCEQLAAALTRRTRVGARYS